MRRIPDAPPSDRRARARSHGHAWASPRATAVAVVVVAILVASLLGVARPAFADPPQPPWSVYPPGLAHRVPLENVKGDVLWAAYEELDARGIAPNLRGLRSDDFLALTASKLLVQPTGPATPLLGSAGDALAGRQGMATTYADLEGSVRGDGRTVAVEGIPLGTAGSTPDALAAQYEVQVKGVATGLRPNGAPANDVHGSGHSWTEQALQDAVMGEFLRLNGVLAERPLIAADLGQIFRDVGYSFKAQKEVENTKRAGLYARGGHFLRLAHLLAASSQDRRALVEQIRRTEEALSGQRMTSPAQLVRRLVERKVAELADLYWLRVAHRSLTYDNQLIFGQGDLSTAEIASQLHPDMGRGLRPELAPGLGREANQVLELYVPELLRLVKSTLSMGARAKWALRPPITPDGAQQLFAARMRENALQRLGLAPAEAALLARARPEPAQRWVTTIQRLAAKSAANAASKPQLDVVAALAELPMALREELDGKDGQRLLAAKLAKSTGAPEAEAQAAAKELLLAAREVLAVALRPFRGDARRGKLELMADRARRINAPLHALEHNRHRLLASKLIKDRYGKIGERAPKRPLSLHTIQSTIDRTLRDAIRTGPYSADGVAERIRDDQLPPVEGWMTLATWVDHGVEVAERSNGQQNRVRVKVALQAWGDKPSPESARLEYRTESGGAWKRASGKVKGSEIVYQVPISGAISCFNARITDGTGRVRLDNSGVLYGTNAAILGSKVVRAELVNWAARKGVAATAADQGLDAATVRASRLTGRRMRALGARRLTARSPR